MQSRAPLTALIILALSASIACSSSPDELPSEPDVETAQSSWTDELIVDPHWLESRLGADDLTILHIGDPDSDAYDLWTAEPIPGQTYIAFHDIVDGTMEEGFGLPDLDALRHRFEEAGVDDDRQIVLTGELDGLMATRAFLSLEALGRSEGVALLDGGYFEWVIDERPTGTADDHHPSSGTLTTDDNPSIIVDAHQVQKYMEDSDYHLVDARPYDEFSGTTPGLGISEDRAGHIPGASHYFWKHALNPSLITTDEHPYASYFDPEHVLFRPLTDIANDYDELGIDDQEILVTYCRTGVQGSFGYFLGRLLDRDVLLYDASFVDWAADADRPVQTP